MAAAWLASSAAVPQYENARQRQVIAELSNELRQIKLEVSGMNGKLGNLVTHTAAHTCSHTRNTDVSAVAGNRRANASETHHARLVLAFRTLRQPQLVGCRPSSECSALFRTGRA